MTAARHARAGSALRLLMIALVRVYQMVLRPVLGPNCRFSPSCSDYALEALTEHGTLRGLGLTAARILRCNPWHPGGHDPVPPAGCCAAHPPLCSDRDRSAR